MSVSAHGRDFAIAACAIACAASSPAFGQSLIWQNNWTESAPPLVVPFFNRSAIAPDGDAIVASVSVTRNDYYLARFSPAGAVRWSTHFGPGNQELDPVTALLPLADGSTYVGFDTPGVGYVGKFSEAGAALWMRNLPANFIVDAPAGSVVVGGCTSAYPRTVVIAKLDAADGQVLWDFEAPDRTSGFFTCALTGLRVGDDGEVYSAISDPSLVSGAVTTVIRLDDTGQVVWTSLLDSSWAPIGLSQDALVLRGAGVRALARTDGAPRWSAAQTAIDGVMAPGSNDPIVLGVSQISRLDGATGDVEWSTNLAESYQAVIVTAGSIVLTGGTNVACVDAAGGSIAWSRALTSPYSIGAYAPYIVGIGAAGNALQSVAYAHGHSDTEFWLQAIDLQSGNVAASVVPSPVERGASDGYSREGSGDRFGVAAFAGPEGSALHVRRLDGFDGTSAWEFSETVDLEPPLAFPGYLYRLSLLDLSVDAKTVAVTAAENLADGYYYTNTFGAAWAGAYDRSTGARRWTTVVQDPFQLFTYTATPALMSNEDVVLAFGASYYEPYYAPPSQFQYSVARLDANDGHVLWRHDVALPSGSYGVLAPIVSRVGSEDLLVAAPLPLELGTATLVRLAGNDGTRLWSSTVLAPGVVDEIHPQSDGTVIVRGSTGWARLDASNGAVLWNSAENADPACPPNNLCYTGSSVARQNGDLLSSGRSGFVPVVVRRHGDGGGAEDFWYLESPVDGTRATAGQIALDAEGTPWVRISRIFSDASYGVEFVGAVDLSTGTLPRQQAIGTYMGDALMPTRTGSLLDGSVGAHLPISAFDGTHNGPATLGDGAIDLTVTASGDLAAQVQTDRSHVALGDSVAFRVSAHYVGDAPIDGVQLLAFVPWSSGLDDVHCTVTPPAACEISTISGNIVSTFALQPGAEVVITGSLKVLGWPATPREFEAVAVGPTGLAEQNTQNNFAHAAITASLFFDGFEQ